MLPSDSYLPCEVCRASKFRSLMHASKLPIGDTANPSPCIYHNDINQIPCILEPKDLLYTLKNAHHSIAAQLADTYISDYENKAGILQQLLGLGFSNGKQVVHNLCVVLNKMIHAGNVFELFDEPKNRNLIELMALVLEKWIEELGDTDSFVLNHVCKILEKLLKTRLFYERMKNRPCLDTLIRIMRSPLTAPATKQLINKIACTFSSIYSYDVIKYYHLDNPDYKRYGSLKTSLLKKSILDSNEGEFYDTVAGYPLEAGAA